MHLPRFAAALVCLVGLSALSALAAPKPAHILVIGVDGLGGRTAFRPTNAPNLHRLMERGSWTLKARGVMPTSSSPNWASMIMGAGPEQHGVTSNDWQTNKLDFPAIVTGPEGMFPTIFGVLRRHSPRAELGAIYDWSDFGRLFERPAVNVSEHVKGSPATAARAIEYLREKRPEFLFVHFDDVDHAGHGSGWETPEYFAAVEQIDGLIGDLLKTLAETGMERRTLVLVTADHGGRGTKHGGNSIEELEIPWILAGPGVRRGLELQRPVNTYDTAPTIAWACGASAPSCWIGRPVREAFH